jgi:cell wall-associated NlpC family hydrolase
MLFFCIRFIVMATLVAALSLVTEFSRPALKVRMAWKPKGWFHDRAMRAHQRRQAAIRDWIVVMARAQLGMPYVWGGASPNLGFDCSGLVLWIFAQVDVPSPRTARLQARIGNPIDREHLSPGDLLTFGIHDSVTHVGIYIGDGRFVHASSVAGKVIVSPVDRPPSELIRPLRGARRILASSL